MQAIYSHQNLFQVTNIKNLLEAKGILSVIKNEYAGGAVGEIAFADSWAELYLVDEQQTDAALLLINETQQHKLDDWQCSECGEVNAGSFELCWKCQTAIESE